MTKKISHLLPLLGFPGTLLCVVGIIGVWYVELRVDQARMQVFERIDQSFSRVNSRLVETQRIAMASKITAVEVQQGLKDWTRQEASERLASRFEIEARVDRFAAGLGQAELFLDASEDTVLHVRQILELGANLGLGINASSVDPLLERLTNLKENLNQSVEITKSLGQLIKEGTKEESLEKRVPQAIQFVAKLLVTFGEVEPHLDALRSRLTYSQDAIGQLNAKTHARVVAVAIGGTVFLVWMGAGQVSLCLHHPNSLT